MDLGVAGGTRHLKTGKRSSGPKSGLETDFQGVPSKQVIVGTIRAGESVEADSRDMSRCPRSEPQRPSSTSWQQEWQMSIQCLLYIRQYQTSGELEREIRDKPLNFLYFFPE